MTTGNAFLANTAGSGTAQKAAPYTLTVAERILPDPTKNIDVYSTNYLNFLYGAKACRDAAQINVAVLPSEGRQESPWQVRL